jgi:arsenite-transporting ATPase
MRIIIYTGKGGVGKTSVAVASAIKSANEGKKTLVVSMSAAQSLEDSLDIKLYNEPTEVIKNLWAVEIDKICAMESSWQIIQDFLKKLFSSYQAVDKITAEELVGFPGLEKLLGFLKIINYYNQKIFDVIIIDCANASDTISLLSYPEILRWWIQKLLPTESKAVKLLSPIAGSLLGIKIPTYEIVTEIEKLYNQLGEIIKIITDRQITSVRLVVIPEKMSIKEAQRSFTYLNIYDFNIDSIIVNKVLSIDDSEAYLKQYKDLQQKYLDTIIQRFDLIPIYNIPLFYQDVVGVDILTKIGDIAFNSKDSTEVKYKSQKQKIEQIGNEYRLVINVPDSDAYELALSQKGQDIIVNIGTIKRIITIPSTIKDFEIIGARFKGDKLEIAFRK